MSLFPAYAEEAQKAEPVENKTDWLENSSFKPELCLENAENSTKRNQEEPQESKAPKRRKKSKKHKKPTSPNKKSEIVLNENDQFTVDVKGHKEYLKVDTIHWPAAPRYSFKYKFLNYSKSNKRKQKRYYNQYLIKKPAAEHKRNDESSVTKDEQITNRFLFKQEEEMSQKTAAFNQHLAERSDDVQKWLEYIRFQDSIYQFEKSYRKGSMAKAQRVLAERKLSILDKALSTNPDCELLHRERLHIASSTFPADELQSYLQNLIEKNQSNIILWQGYIEATQCSMSHCNTPAVMGLYTKCLSTLHQLRRSTAVDRYVLEENILRMLYQCGLFLKQAGLFEQLWTLLKMYLELNLSQNDKDKFNNAISCNEKQLRELEEVIFTSQLPLHELWLRVEKLRESCHWLPVSSDDTSCEDPQRLVFAEDVAELIHPITTPENMFKLTVIIFTLLKIPLIPCRHTTMQELGLDYVPWNLDSIEPLLALLLPPHPVEISTDLLNTRLAVGPQYLKSVPGQEEYLEFIMSIMKSCSECLTGNDKIAVTIWFFKFQRLLVILDGQQWFKCSSSFKKIVKKNMKEFLKQEDNRQNELYYLEYALLENALGNADSCESIIKTALKFSKITSLKTSNYDFSQAKYCASYRALIELKLSKSINEEIKQNVLQHLSEMILCKQINKLTCETINEASTKSRLIVQEILEKNLTTVSTLDHFFPNFVIDFIICTGWFIYLSNGIEAFVSFIDETVKKIEDMDENLIWQKEVLSEFTVTVLFKHTTETSASGYHQVLQKELLKTVENYPNNLFLLGLLAKYQCSIHNSGPRWWLIENVLIKSGRSLSTMFAIIILKKQTEHFMNLALDPITGETCAIDLNSKNRMLSLFKKITSVNANTRRCGLIWRLYLEFVHTYCSSQLCRNVYYSAVEECPWLKALYIDAAIYIPAELAQIQDLIIEKQLRLHVTPEELDILRN